VTDRQTDRILLAIPRLHYMQRGKNPSQSRVFIASVESRAEKKTVQSEAILVDLAV